MSRSTAHRGLEDNMNIRAYTSDDFDLVASWANARDIAFHPAFLSKNGFIVTDDAGEPCAVSWVYLVFDVPIAMVDNFITRPNTSMKTSRSAWRIMWSTIISFLENLVNCEGQPMQYQFVRTHCKTPLARFAKSDGWHVATTTSNQITYEITPRLP